MNGLNLVFETKYWWWWDKKTLTPRACAILFFFLGWLVSFINTAPSFAFQCISEFNSLYSPAHKSGASDTDK
jgi:hypothetical protein